MSVYDEWSAVYAELGFWPRRIRRGTKASYDPGWQRPGPLDPGALLQPRETDGIALLMGSPFPDGTTLGAADIDRDQYVPLGRALFGNPCCARFGSKGIAYFVRVRGVSNFECRPGGEAGKAFGKVAEFLFHKKLCVIPPTIHPETANPYRWIGTPLHEVDFNDLPIVEA